MLQLHLSDQQLYCLLWCGLYYRLDGNCCSTSRFRWSCSIKYHGLNSTRLADTYRRLKTRPLLVWGNGFSPVRYHTQCWFIHDATTRNILQWNLNECAIIFMSFANWKPFLKLIDWTQDFPLFQVASKVNYYRPAAVPSMGVRRGIYMGNMSIS